MEIIESTVFARIRAELWSDEAYRALQTTLILQPDIGDLIRGGGGLRKMRWVTRGRGKQGGTRVIYYWAVGDEQIFLLAAYDKSRKDDLTKEEVKRLRGLIE